MRTACSGWRCATSTRPAPIPDGEIGEDHDPETHLIPLVIGAALGTRPPVKVFGTDYPTPDGTAVRDYVHVIDLADAHLRALERLGNGTAEPGDQPRHRTAAQSCGRVIETVEARRAGRTCRSTMAPRRAGDPPELVAAPGRARDVLGWSCRYAALDVIVEHAWKWHASRA